MERSSSCSAWKGAAEPASRQSNACSSNSTLPQFWAALNWVCHWSSVSHFPPGIIKSACKMVPKRENGAQIHTEKLQRGTFLKETSQQCPTWALQERDIFLPLAHQPLSFPQLSESSDSPGHGKHKKHTVLCQHLSLPVTKQGAALSTKEMQGFNLCVFPKPSVPERRKRNTVTQKKAI